jgi:hypothetical protein
MQQPYLWVIADEKLKALLGVDRFQGFTGGTPPAHVDSP